MKDDSRAGLSHLFVTRVLSRKEITKEIIEMALEKPQGFIFSPGQRIRLIHERGERDYSLVSSPECSHLMILFKVVPEGKLSPFLAEAETGASLSFSGPHGYFLRLPSERPAVFVATGTGAAPFIAMTKSGARGFIMVYGVKRREELYGQSLLQAAAREFAACISDFSAGTRPDDFQGRVTAYINSRLSPGVYDFYLCGRREMIRDVTLLVDERFPGSSVYTEIFY
jgi:benzoate/toluate 1,2-dioxygenase reductase component